MGDYLEKASYDWSEDSVRIICTPSRQAKQLFYYVQEIGYFKTNWPYFTERKGLASYLVIYTLSGKGKLYYNGKNYVLGKGSLCFIDCREHHRYETEKEEEWEFLWIHLYGNSSAGYYAQFMQDDNPVLNIQYGAVIESILWDLMETNGKRGKIWEMVSSEQITRLLTQILLHKTTREEDTIMNLPNYIKDAVRFIDKHFQEDISLFQLAKQVSLSQFHLSREFKKYVGMTFKEYLITTRMNYAKELLKHSEYAIEEIAEFSGIPNVSHFIKLFKTREEMTPSKYRNHWKNML